jgi:hypothetical protein
VVVHNLHQIIGVFSFDCVELIGAFSSNHDALVIVFLIDCDAIDDV